MIRTYTPPPPKKKAFFWQVRVATWYVVIGYSGGTKWYIQLLFFILVSCSI